ncbi:MAG: NAD(P)H-binding protein [Actinomycetota bacterium]|nr:NAD(P)H-binding protein [Actinomycetota bacterium]
METENRQQTKTTLVLGGTGKTGRRVAERLEARGLPTRIGSRSGEPPFDWEDEATWAPALQNVESVYVTYYPDLAIPGAVGAIRSFAELAVERGIRRLVLLSGRGEEGSQRAEQVVRDSGVDWTIVRVSFFSQNFDENYLLEPILGGEVALPAGDVPEPFVDADDIADVAVAALTEDGHAGKIYELTGPRLLTFAEAVGEIAQAAGREVRYVPISVEQFASALTQDEVPSQITWLLTYVFTEVLDGRNAYLTDGVQRALGREPKDFSDYARDTAATGVWNGSGVLGTFGGSHARNKKNARKERSTRNGSKV